MVWPIFNRANVPCSMLAHLRGRKLWRRFLLLPLAELVTSHLQDGAQTLHLPGKLSRLPSPCCQTLDLEPRLRDSEKFEEVSICSFVKNSNFERWFVECAERIHSKHSSVCEPALPADEKLLPGLILFICQHFFCSRASGVELEVASHEALKDLQLNTYQLCRKFLVQGHDISTTVNTSKLPTVHVLNRYNPTRMIHRTTKRKNEREKSEITFNYRTRKRLF